MFAKEKRREVKRIQSCMQERKGEKKATVSYVSSHRQQRQQQHHTQLQKVAATSTHKSY